MAVASDNAMQCHAMHVWFSYKNVVCPIYSPITMSANEWSCHGFISLALRHENDDELSEKLTVCSNDAQ